MTFPSPNTTRGGKVKNRARMTWFCTRNISTQFTVQFLSFPISTTEKSFDQLLATFSSPNTTRRGKVKTGPEWLDFAPKTYPYSLRCNSYCFPLLRLNNVSVEFDEVSRLGHRQNGLGAAKVQSQTRMTRLGTQRISTLFKVHFLSFPISSSQAGKIENRAPMNGFVPETYTLWGVVFIVSRQIDLKLYQTNFEDFCGTRHHQSRPHTVWGAVFIISSQCSWKIFWSNFADFSGPEHHRSRLSRKQGPNDPVLHSKHTHPVWGAILIIYCQYGWKMFRSNFDDFSEPKRNHSK